MAAVFTLPSLPAKDYGPVMFNPCDCSGAGPVAPGRRQRPECATSECGSVPGLVVHDEADERNSGAAYRGWGRSPSRMIWAMCAERWRLVSAPAWRTAAKAPATSAITSSTVTSSRTAFAACARSSRSATWRVRSAATSGAAVRKFTPGFFSHPLGTTGFETGKDAWRKLTAQFPGMRVVAEDILVDGDKVTVRSAVEGTGTRDGVPQPMLIEIFRIEGGRLAENWGSTWLPRLS